MVLRLAQGLASRGIPTDLVVFARRGELVEELGDAVNLVDLGGLRASRSLIALVRYLRQRQPAALLVTLQHTTIVTAAALRLAGARTRMVIREANHLGVTFRRHPRVQRGARVRATRWAYRQARLVTAVSEGVAEEVRGFLGRGAPPVVVRPNPVIGGEFTAAVAEKPEHKWLAEDGRTWPVIVTAGRLVKQKDHATLLRAFARVRSIHDARMVIFGEGPERSALERLAHELGIADAVDMPGFERRVLPALRAADLFVLASRWEGMPGALIQAMACGTPVVSTDCASGPAELLAGGLWGRLVPIGDPAAMAAALVDGIEGRVPPPPDEAVQRYHVTDAVDRCVADLLGAEAPT